MLIPKNESSETMSHFWPLSLCNVIYKILAKVIVNRIKPCLAQLTGEELRSFVPGRHITNNIILVQEAIYLMDRMTSKKGFMIIKFNLEKANDKLSWKFIEDTLLDANLLSSTVPLIMCCVMSSRFSVLWNGEPSG